MHRRPDFELLPLDTKIEITLRSLKKTKRIEKIVMEESQIYRNEGGNPQHRMVEI